MQNEIMVLYDNRTRSYKVLMKNQAMQLLSPRVNKAAGNQYRHVQDPAEIERAVTAYRQGLPTKDTPNFTHHTGPGAAYDANPNGPVPLATEVPEVPKPVVRRSRKAADAEANLEVETITVSNAPNE